MLPTQHNGISSEDRNAYLHLPIWTFPFCDRVALRPFLEAIVQPIKSFEWLSTRPGSAVGECRSVDTHLPIGLRGVVDKSALSLSFMNVRIQDQVSIPAAFCNCIPLFSLTMVTAQTQSISDVLRFRLFEGLRCIHIYGSLNK
jgi:hypothetical protein